MAEKPKKDRLERVAVFVSIIKGLAQILVTLKALLGI